MPSRLASEHNRHSDPAHGIFCPALTEFGRGPERGRLEPLRGWLCGSLQGHEALPALYGVPLRPCPPPRKRPVGAAVYARLGVREERLRKHDPAGATPVADINWGS